MHRGLATVIKGVGWLLVLAVPYVLLGALLAPRLVQFLNPVVCGKIGSLTNRSIGSSSVELVCRGNGNPNVTVRIVLVLVVLVVLAMVCFAVATRLLDPKSRIVTAEARR